jgi:ubiquinone biosynthesis protein
MKNNLELLIGAAALNSVLPEAYAHYRRPIQGALGLFIELLEPVHRLAIMHKQALLPPTASAAERLALLARSCPALHKLGQSLARDRRLTAELRGHLQQLESIPPSVDFDIIEQELARELGPLEPLGVTLLPPALAEASVAVVVPFRWQRAQNDLRQGVFKVLKPGIAERLEHELGLLEKVGEYLDQRCVQFDIPRLDYQGTFEQVRDKLRNEVRLDLEQRHLAMAAEFYAEDPGVQIAALYPFCTPRVTAMERVWGHKVTDHTLNGYSGVQLAQRVIQALVARPVLSRSPKAFFHADPHAGNLLFTDRGKLAVLDWSLVGGLSERDRTVMVQVLLGALLLDAPAITRLLLDLNTSVRVRRPALTAVVDAWLKRIGLFRPPGFSWLTGMLDEAVQHAGLGLGADLLLFRKSMHLLEGVIADIGAPQDALDQVLLRQFLLHLAGEWPLRWLRPPFSRAYATRLSNADLLDSVLKVPMAMGRHLAVAKSTWQG